MDEYTGLIFDHPIQALEYFGAKRRDATALSFPHEDKRLSFGAWLNEALTLAGGLDAMGIGHGDHVALLAENRMAWPVTQMAVAALGAVLVPLNTHYRREELAYSLAQSDAKAILTSRSFRSHKYLENVLALKPELERLEHIICLDGSAPGVTAAEHIRATEKFSPRIEPDSIGTLLYTSGTTGFAKGALLTNRAMMANARATARRLGVGPQDRWTSIIPLFHCAGCIMNLLGCLQTGATYVGVPAFTARTMFEVIEAERCTLLSGVPTSYLAMLDDPLRSEHDLSTLRAGTCGGADCNTDTLQSCTAEFPMPGLVQVYGQTEGATLIACPEIGDAKRLHTAGPPLDGYEVRIVDPGTDEALDAGAIGEIQARGEMIMQGYYRDVEATGATIVEGGWLRTGDLGYLDVEGRLVVSGGRLKDMIIRGGENIYPMEVENVLQLHPAVQTVAVFALPDDYYGESVAAAVALAPTPSTVGDDSPDSRALHAYCSQRLAGFKVPAQWFEMETFPMTASGKIRKVELREMAAAGQLTRLP